MKKYCESKGIGYSTSVWDNTSAKEIASIAPDFIKIPSPCNNNFEMLETLRDEYKGDLHISTGMTFKKEIEERNNFNPLVNTGQKNPYLVDQHLLEKENA